MASGSLSGNKSYDGRYFIFYWSTSKVSPGVSNVSWNLQAVGGSASYYYSSYSLTVNGSTYSQDWQATYTGVKCSGSFNISHGTSGSAGFSVSLTSAVYNFSSGTVSNTFYADTNYPYTACSVSSASISITQGKDSANNINPTNNVISITAAGSSGTANALTGMKIYYSAADSATTPNIELVTIASGSTFTSTDILTADMRGKVVQFGVKAIGTVSGYDSSIYTIPEQFYVNNLPTLSTITYDKDVVPSSGGNITVTFNNGSTNNTGQTLTHRYKINGGNIQSTTNNSITLSLDGNNPTNLKTYSLEWWEYDGLEESARHNTYNFYRNSKPTFTWNDTYTSLETVTDTSTYLNSYKYLKEFTSVIFESYNDTILKDVSGTVYMYENNISKHSESFNLGKISSIEQTYESIRNALNRCLNSNDYTLGNKVQFKLQLNNGYENSDLTNQKNNDTFVIPKKPNGYRIIKAYPVAETTWDNIEIPDPESTKTIGETSYGNAFSKNIIVEWEKPAIQPGERKIIGKPAINVNGKNIISDKFNTDELDVITKTTYQAKLYNDDTDYSNIQAEIVIEDSEEQIDIVTYSATWKRVEELTSTKNTLNTTGVPKIIKPFSEIKGLWGNSGTLSFSLQMTDTITNGNKSSISQGGGDVLHFSLDMYNGEELIANLFNYGVIHYISGNSYQFKCYNKNEITGVKTLVDGITTSNLGNNNVQFTFSNTFLENVLCNEQYAKDNKKFENVIIRMTCYDIFNQSVIQDSKDNIITLNYQEAPSFSIDSTSTAATNINEVKTYNNGSHWNIATGTITTSTSRSNIETRFINPGDKLRFTLPPAYDINWNESNNYKYIVEQFRVNQIDLTNLNNTSVEGQTYNKIAELPAIRGNNGTFAQQDIEINIEEPNEEYICGYRVKLVDTNNQSSGYVYFRTRLIKSRITIPQLTINNIIETPSGTEHKTYLVADVDWNYVNYEGTELLVGDTKYSSYTRSCDTSIAAATSYKPQIKLRRALLKEQLDIDYEEATQTTVPKLINEKIGYYYLNPQTKINFIFNSGDDTDEGSVLYYQAIITIYTGNNTFYTAKSNVYSLFRESPTVAYRKNKLGVNTNDVESMRIITNDQTYDTNMFPSLYIRNFEGNNKKNNYIVLRGDNANGENSIIIDLITGEIQNLIIDCGSWDIS